MYVHVLVNVIARINIMINIIHYQKLLNKGVSMIHLVCIHLTCNEKLKNHLN